MTKFMIGAATAAHQVEGNNKSSDFWTMEQMDNSNFIEPSNQAVDHYNRYKEDIDLLKNAGLNTYRFSIEWARIEPIKGKYDLSEVEHYRSVLEYCRDNNLTTIVTLHHFSSPLWLMHEGGWESEKVVGYFENYVALVVAELGSLMDYICTINELNSGLQIAKKVSAYKKMIEGDLQVGLNVQSEEKRKLTEQELVKIFGTKDVHIFLSARSEKSDEIVMEAHQRARTKIKEINPEIQVGMTLSLHDFQYLDEQGKKRAEEEWEDEFLRYTSIIRDDDFFGLQNYARTIYDKNGKVMPTKETKVTQMGYEYYPEGLENVIRKVSAVIDIPIIVTENGVATDVDEDRIAYIERAMKGVRNCLDDGLPVLGYTYWSLLDNFEWQKGFAYTFGLIEVDRLTQRRIPKKSLKALGEIAHRVLNIE